MNKIRKTLFFFLLTALTLHTSCTTEEDRLFGKEKSLKLNLTFTPLQSKATENSNYDGAFNEDKINSLDVFFYQGNILRWHISTGSSTIIYSKESRQATIPVTPEIRELLQNNTDTYDIYVVANNKANISGITVGGHNLEILKNLVFKTPDFVTKGGREAQTDFLMDGKLSKVVNLSQPSLGTVNLKRAAAKIRLRLTDVSVKDYERDETIPIQAFLTHFTDKSVLLEEGTALTMTESDWEQTEGSEVATTLSGGLIGKSTAAPFYAYENDWSNNPNLETYIELYIPLKNISLGETNTYKYRVPITPKELTGDDAKYMNRLYRNHLYDIDVAVKILGGLEEPAVEIPGNYQIRNWSTQEVLVDIKGSHYLVVSERNVTMPNVSSYVLNFNSSIPNVTLVEGSLKATYTYVEFSTGEPSTQTTRGDQFPTVAVAPNVASGTITINSAIPVNYLPKDIEFQVTNGSLTETIKVRQLPATYFTAEKGDRSSLRPDGRWKDNDPEEENKYMYGITTLAPDGEQIWGFPPIDNNGYTVNSSEVANMISPKFEMASQLGATPLSNSHTNAQEQCKAYWETTEDEVRKENWRLPTEAEIIFIDELQRRTGENFIGIVMAGKWYWDSYGSNGASMLQGGSGGSNESAYVRCIRDIKD